MSLSKREKLLLGILGMVGGFYLYYHYLFQPLCLETQQTETENTELSRQLQEVQKKLSEQYKTSAEQQSIMHDYRTMMIKVPASPMVYDCVNYLCIKAQESHIQLLANSYREKPINNLAVNNPEKQSNNSSQLFSEFKITAQGTHYNLLIFLQQIENAPRIITINESKIYLPKSELTPVANLPKDLGEEGQDAQNIIALANPIKESNYYDAGVAELYLDFTVYYGN